MNTTIDNNISTLSPIGKAYPSGVNSKKRTCTKMDIQDWIFIRISEQFDIKVFDIDTEEPFSRYGLDSIDSANFSGELGSWLGHPLSNTLLWDYPNIETLSKYLFENFSK